MAVKSIRTLGKLGGKRVLVRTDFNVPVKKGVVLESFRVLESVPTIEYLTKKGAAAIIVSHMGRPKKYDAALSLKPVVPVLESALGKPVHFVSFKNADSFTKAVAKITPQPGEVWLLENIRFVPGETSSDAALVKQLAALADYFVSDCFAVAHRSSASVTGVAKKLPSAAGLLMEREVAALSRVMKKPKRPLVVMLGGAKAETKIPLIKNFIKHAQTILVAGGIANTYFAALGHQLGASVYDAASRTVFKKLCASKKIILPHDLVVGTSDGKKTRIVRLDQKLRLKKTEGVWDIGPSTVRAFARVLRSANTIIWNGAMGRFEVHPYEYGTYALARYMAARAKGPSYGLVGGGETIQVVQQLGLTSEIDFVSTGGGAMLEFFGGTELPGVKVVSQKK